MKKYSPEYWFAHYEYAMGKKEKLDIDTSNADWTKNGLTKILNGEAPYGWTGTNGAIALVNYIEKYHPEKLNEVLKIMIEYIESIQTPEKPLKKIHNYYLQQLNLRKG
jgi:hypothetical protein